MNVRRLPHQAPAQKPTTGGIWRMFPGGTAGNARLTALSGLIIFVLLAAEGLTLLRIRTLITPHAFIGFLLIPPIALKLASVGYRFTLYYSGNARYRAAGPPHPLPRILAPLLVASTIILFATGVILVITPPNEGDIWRRLHTIVFLGWFVLMSAHVLTYLLRALGLTEADLTGRGPQTVAGTLDRRMLVAGSVILGLVLAIVFLPWDSTWAHWLQAFRQDQ